MIARLPFGSINTHNEHAVVHRSIMVQSCFPRFFLECLYDHGEQNCSMVIKLIEGVVAVRGFTINMTCVPKLNRFRFSFFSCDGVRRSVTMLTVMRNFKIVFRRYDRATRLAPITDNLEYIASAAKTAASFLCDLGFLISAIRTFHDFSHCFYLRT